MKLQQRVFFFTFFILSALFVHNASAQTFTVNQAAAKVSFDYVAEETTGTLGGFTAKITFDPANLGSAKISGSVDVKKLSTGEDMRDEHLMSVEYFDAAKYPKMTFTSTSINAKDGGFVMTGKLTIKNITKDVTINFKKNDRAFIGTMDIYSNDFQLMPRKKREDSLIKIKFDIPVK